MTIIYLKKTIKAPAAEDATTRETVTRKLDEIEAGGEDVARRYAKEFDGWEQNIVMSRESLEKAIKTVPETVKDDIRFARDRIRDFAQRQRDSMQEFEVELLNGLVVGPGNRFVAEAKRMLFGRIGIDVVAGPTESMVAADETADPAIVAADLIGQAEHGPDSPVWLVTTSREVGEKVMALAPGIIANLPELAHNSATAAWRDYGEVVLVDTREEIAQVCDQYAPEHLQIQAIDPEWWLANLRNYGSLFMGEEATVAYGDKCSGPNHILPTRGAARYSGGLSASKFLKVLTYQRLNRAACKVIAPVAARISRLEGIGRSCHDSRCTFRKILPHRIFRVG